MSVAGPPWAPLPLKHGGDDAPLPTAMATTLAHRVRTARHSVATCVQLQGVWVGLSVWDPAPTRATGENPQPAGYTRPFPLFALKLGSCPLVPVLWPGELKTDTCVLG